MSSTYYIGTYEKDIDGYHRINKPIFLTGITASFLEDLLEASNIDTYEDFTRCSTADMVKPLFYTIDKTWIGELNPKYEDCYIDGIAMDKLPDTYYPLICDRIEHNGLTLFIKEEVIQEPNYNNFNSLTINKNTVVGYIKDNNYFRNNNSDFILNELSNTYNIIVSWIKENKAIYWYQYY